MAAYVGVPSAHWVTMDQIARTYYLGYLLAAAASVGVAIALWQVFALRVPIIEAAPAAPGYTVVQSAEPILPVPDFIVAEHRKVELGERLFNDVRLSRNDTISCASCHDLGNGGDDGQRRSSGVGGAESAINAPTVFNSGLNFVQFWDGRAASLEDQIDGPIHHPDEMGSNWPAILRKLSGDPDYVRTFAKIYPEGLSEHAAKDAIATFERTLVTPGARFDRFLRGEAAAITPAEREGYALFKSLGCISCHQGRNVGGNMFQTFGVMGDYFADRGSPTPADDGRFNVTGDARDRYVFKVPSLRNVALTPPYFHDGSAATLGQAVAVMAWYQLGRRLKEREVGLIVAFLKTLTGRYQRAAR